MACMGLAPHALGSLRMNFSRPLTQQAGVPHGPSAQLLCEWTMQMVCMWSQRNEPLEQR